MTEQEQQEYARLMWERDEARRFIQRHQGDDALTRHLDEVDDGTPVAQACGSSVVNDDYLGIPARHVEYLCAVMHSAYEDEAARVGWETNARSKTSWDRVPEENKQAMRAGVRALLDYLFDPSDDKQPAGIAPATDDAST